MRSPAPRGQESGGPPPSRLHAHAADKVMKKNQIYEGKVEKVRFPNRGIVTECRPMRAGEDGEYAAGDEPAESCRVTVKNTLPGQRVSFAVQRCRSGSAEGRLLEVTERSLAELKEPACPHFGDCGGCSYQTLPYEEQLKLKAGQVTELLREAEPCADDLFEGIRPSPRQFGYRNKMEFTFGDEYKDGPLALGMHRRGSIYDIVSVDRCQIVDEDYRKILAATQDYFREAGTPFYHRVRHEGYLRHLLVRKAARTGEILVDLVTTTQSAVPPSADGETGPETVRPSDESSTVYEDRLLDGWKDRMLMLAAEGSIVGILHTHNDSLGDVVKDGGTDILYGRDFFSEELLGLTFKITPFSFFQTNSFGAEVLYRTAREFIWDTLEDGASGRKYAGPGEDGNAFRTNGGKLVFDLYSGTGTIAQMLAPAAKKVVGVEIVPEAVRAAEENARANGLDNCEFIAGDVLRVLDDLEEKPDLIVLDPPRDGVHPKALKKIIDCNVPKILYISCKPTSLQRDLKILTESGYRAERICCVDMFPGTVQIETVVSLGRTE